MASDRDVALRLVVIGLAADLVPPSTPPGTTPLLARNAADTMLQRVTTRLRQALEIWERTGEEPDWEHVTASMATDGSEYVGPTGTWVEFDEEDLPVLSYMADFLAEYVRKQLEAALRALDQR